MAVFSKQNLTGAKDSLFKEAQGLNLLRETLKHSNNPYLHIPEVHGVSETLLQLTEIDSHPATALQMQQLGQGLALLHQRPQARYGLAEDNYIGASPQPNTLTDNWGVFFVENRLAYQISRIADASIQQDFTALLDAHRSTVSDFLNEHCTHPSLLHGDLWSGNVMFDREQVWLIDPAVYYGDREADIAMTEMFGGFSAEFYKAYDNTCPRTSAYPQKKNLYNLYHYLNHYNLFGRSYLAACKKGFEQLRKI